MNAGMLCHIFLFRTNAFHPVSTLRLRMTSSICLLLVLATSGTLQASPVAPNWVWVGAVSDSSAVVHAGWPHEPAQATLPLRLRRTGQLPAQSVEIPPVEERPAGSLGRMARYTLEGLTPDTSYSYFWIEQDDSTGEDSAGQFRTFPAAGEPARFSFAFGSCAQTGSEHPVFDEIRRLQPLFFLHTGDLHYENIAVNDQALYQNAIARVFASTVQNRFFRSFGVSYMWDDHDFGPNNSDSTAASRPAALAAYRSIVPHYPLALTNDPQAPVGQSFTVGRVRFILADLRSARDANKSPDGPQKSMFSHAQRVWFFDELKTARDSHALIVWLSSMPWIADDGSSDRWSSFSHERRLISDFIVQQNIRNLVLLSGDSHMLAADDGRHNRYATDAIGPGFPVYHAAALDKSGSVKGGPYSEGAFPGPGQFGLLQVEDFGNRIQVTFEGRNANGEILLKHAFTRSVPMQTPQTQAQP